MWGKWKMLIRAWPVDTIGNCQRPVFSLDVSHHMHHEITNLSTFKLNRSSKLRIIMKEKAPLSHEVVCFLMLDFDTSNSKSEVSKSNSRKITSFSKTTYFRGNRFSQCLIPPTSPHYSLPSNVYASNNFE